jgi:hypothetical protein
MQLGERLSDTLDCVANCNQRFRLVLERGGELEIEMQVSVQGEGELMRLILEGTAAGVMARRSTLADPRPLVIRQVVQPGVYFVLVQGVGESIPFAIAATLNASEDVPVAGRPAAPVVAAGLPPGPAIPERVKSERGLGSEAAWDPTVDFKVYRSFAFAPIEQGGVGTPMEEPYHRRIRRALATELELKGFARAELDTADLLIGFGVGNSTRTWFGMVHPAWFDRWADAGAHVGPHVYSRGTLSIDIVDPRAQRLIWHSWSSQGLEPGTDELDVIQRAAADVLAKFPPAP